MHHRHLRLLCGAAAGLLAAATSAQAAEGGDADLVSEVVVTATKRGATTVQDTPLTITAFDGKAIERLGTTALDDVLAQVPGVNFLDNGGPGRGNSLVSIRGLSAVADNTLPVVAQYLDGAPRFIQNYRMFDIGEVFVLRGPQGTLWGAQAIGGVISSRSVRPNLGASEGFLQADSYATRRAGDLSGRITGAFGMPIITDKLAIRVAGQYIDESGYVDSALTGAKDLNSVKETSWRASLRWKPVDYIDVSLIYHGNDLKSGASSAFSLRGGQFKTDNPLDSRPASQNFDLVNGVIDVDFGSVALNYTGSYFNFKNRSFESSLNVFSTGATGVVDALNNQKSWTHEVRLSSQGERRLNWIVGVFYDNLDIDNLNTTREIINPVTQRRPAFAPGFVFSVLGGPENRREKAVFGEVYYKLTDTIEIMGGARLFNWRVNNRQQFTFFGQNFQQKTGKVGGTDEFFKVGINYKPNSDTLIYALRSEGFRPGGFNPFVGPALNIPETYVKFEPDKLINYEAGAKTQLLDRRLSLGGAVYLMNWKNIQTVVYNASNSFAFTTNAPDLRAWGAELELSSQDLIVEGLFLSASYSYTKNKFLDNAQVFPGTRYLVEKGDQLRRTVRHSWSANAEYRFEPMAGISAYVRANYWHKSRSSSEGFNSGTGDISLPAQDVVNGSVGFDRGRVGLRLYVNNLTDELAIMNVLPLPGSPTTPAEATAVRPRTFGVEATVRF